MYNLAILGYPLGHSISPLIHNRFLDFLGLQGSYQKIEIPDVVFEARIKQLKTENWQGFNITVPHKQRIIPFLDETDNIAAEIGAVNTVKIQNDGKWHGYNSDYLGFLKPLQDGNVGVRNVLIAGAGGSARAIAFGLLKSYPIEEMVIVNRTLKRAADLIESLKKFREADFYPVTFSELDNFKNPFDLIVNTTSVGMGSSSADLSLDPGPFAHKQTVCYDLIYNPLKTRFLQIAEGHNLPVINGLPMLVYQALASFEIWTGKTVTDDFSRKLIDELPAFL